MPFIDRQQGVGVGGVGRQGVGVGGQAGGGGGGAGRAGDIFRASFVEFSAHLLRLLPFIIVAKHS
jgi:hypothetical protein